MAKKSPLVKHLEFRLAPPRGRLAEEFFAAKRPPAEEIAGIFAKPCLALYAGRRLRLLTSVGDTFRCSKNHRRRSCRQDGDTCIVRKVGPEWAVGPSKIRAFLGSGSTGAVLR